VCLLTMDVVFAIEGQAGCPPLKMFNRKKAVYLQTAAPRPARTASAGDVEAGRLSRIVDKVWG